MPGKPYEADTSQQRGEKGLLCELLVLPPGSGGEGAGSVSYQAQVRLQEVE